MTRAVAGLSSSAAGGIGEVIYAAAVDICTSSAAGDTPAPTLRLCTAAFAEAVRSRRQQAGWSQRQVALAAGVSFMTVSRVENGDEPALDVFLSLCAWLRLPPGLFLAAPEQPETDPLTAACAVLAADPLLTADAAEMIAATMRSMHAVFAQPRPCAVPVVAHLADPSPLRPGVEQRLAALFTDMSAALNASG